MSQISAIGRFFLFSICSSFQTMRSIFLIVLLLVVLTNGQELPDFDITNEEIVSLVNEMRNADTNKARPGQIQLDYQGKYSLVFQTIPTIRSHWFNEQRWQSTKTVSQFCCSDKTETKIKWWINLFPQNIRNTVI